MKTLAELEAERDRIQAMIDKGEYQPETLEAAFRRFLRERYGDSPAFNYNSSWALVDLARRHLLPIVTAGEAVDDDIGLAWNGHDWRPARKERYRFVGLCAEIVGVTHWLPAARVPGPTQEPRA